MCVVDIAPSAADSQATAPTPVLEPSAGTLAPPDGAAFRSAASLLSAPSTEHGALEGGHSAFQGFPAAPSRHAHRQTAELLHTSGAPTLQKPLERKALASEISASRLLELRSVSVEGSAAGGNDTLEAMLADLELQVRRTAHGRAARYL